MGFDKNKRKIATPGISTGIGAGFDKTLRMGKAIYEFAVDGGTSGLITPAKNILLPDNAIIVSGFANPTTALTSGGSATIAIGTSAGSSASALKAATAVATYSADALIALVPVFTAATAVKLTAAGKLTITVAVADLIGGVMEITVFYYLAAN